MEIGPVEAGLQKYGGVYGNQLVNILAEETDTALQRAGYAMQLALLNTICFSEDFD